MRRGLFLLLFALLSLMPGHADNGKLSLPALLSLAGASANDRIIVAGENRGGSAAVLVLRIDDTQSRDYASRANLERVLPAGPFRWEVNLRGLKTSSGRRLDLATATGAHLFVASGDGPVEVTRFDIAHAEPLPGGAIAYSFGAADAPLFAGFVRITPDDPMIAYGNPKAIERPGPDPLIASGIAGVEKLVIPWPRGQAHVTIWTEDPGDWENLPHPLQRRIRVNGRDVLYETFSTDEWLKKRYLRGLLQEHGPEDDAWTAYGRHRGGMLSFEAAASDGSIAIEFAGDSPSATFMNAVVVEASGESAARDEVEARRARWYRNQWPIVKQEPDVFGAAIGEARVFEAAASGVRIKLAVASAETIEKPEIRIQAPALNGHALPLRAWSALRRLERRGAGDTTLTLSDNALIANLSALPLRKGEPRRYELWIDIPADAPPGRYRGALSVANAKAPIPAQDFEVEVLPVALPAVVMPSGFYLDEAPQWAWFWGLGASRDRQVECDLRLLNSFGITGNAPALATPLGGGREGFLRDMGLASKHGVATPWLAYTPAKRLYDRAGLEESARLIAEAEASLKAGGLPAPVWSIADEPGNADSSASHLKRWIEALRKAAPSAKLAAQLNAPHDAAIATLFDVVLLNPGFGIDERTISALKHAGKDVWLYNTGHPRFTAGLWLWHTKAGRYVQWHARMPAADPFDPLDGHEGDVQMIFPSAEACPAQPNIHRDLLEMAEGLVDQRWLLWLDTRGDRAAKALAADLHDKLKGNFAQAASLTRKDMDAVRASIAELARRPKVSQQ